MYVLQPMSKSNDRKYFTIGETKNSLKEILNNMDKESLFDEFTYKKQRIAIEFISGVSNFLDKNSGIICGKLSRARDKHAYQLRTQGTANDAEIAVKKNQLFEARSYFLLDTDNMVIGYLNEKAAPSIDSLGDWIYEFTKRKDKINQIWGEVTGIATKDMIEDLQKAEYLGNIEYTMEIPQDLAVEKTNLPETEYRKLKNQKMIRLKMSLVAEKRNVSSFKDKKDIKSFFNYLKGNPFINKIGVKMRDKKGDHVREVKLVNNPLNYSINFDFNTIDKNYDNVISDRIKNEYLCNKNEISNLYT